MEFILKVHEQDLSVLGQALQELPYKVVADLLNRIQAQINEQTTVKNTPAPPEENKPN